MAGGPCRGRTAGRRSAGRTRQHCVLGGHPKVAPERELNTPGHRVPLDGGDHRLAQRQPGGPHGAGPVVRDGPSVPFGHRLQVGAGAEGLTGTGQDSDGTVVVAVEGFEGLPQLIGADAVDGVAPLGRLMVMTVTGPSCSTRTESARYGWYGPDEGSSAGGEGHMEAFSHGGTGSLYSRRLLVPRWEPLFCDPVRTRGKMTNHVDNCGNNR